MKQYYNKNTEEWYTEGQSITRKIENGVFSGIPTIEQLLEWGFEEQIAPEPTEEELIEQARQNKLNDLDYYDSSSEVNSFSINGKDMWLDAATRQQLKTSIDAMRTTGRETVTKWFENEQYTYPPLIWYQMLAAVEVYAADALNVTESHRAAIKSLTELNDINNYDFTVGYPQKLNF